MLLSILGLAVELWDVAFKVESVESAGKISFSLFDVVATVVVGAFDHLLSLFAFLRLKK